MVAPASLAASLTAAAALLILSPRAFALPTGGAAPASAQDDALSVRGLFDPPTSKNIYEYHAGTGNGHSTFSGSLKKDDWLSGKDTRKEMDKMFPHRFDSPQQSTPYDEYDGGPVVERRDTTTAAVVVQKRGSILGAIWEAMKEGVEVPLGKKHSLGFKIRVPGLKEVIKYWKMKTEVDKMSLPITNMQEDNGPGGRRKGWVDKYSKAKKREIGEETEPTVTEAPTTAATATGDDVEVTETHVIWIDEAKEGPITWQIQGSTLTVITGVYPQSTPVVVLTPVAEPEVEATPTPTPQATGGGCGHH
ncbi:hypothetical protein V8F33_008618 [Rhypophila sp. PSN 637]